MAKCIKRQPVIVASAGRGKFRIMADARFIGDDILVSVWGGTKPHIGSVAVAQHRPSLQDPHRSSATSSIINYLGHKDDVVAKLFAEKIASTMNCRCITTAGIHIDKADDDDLSLILKNCDALCSRMVTILKRKK